MTTRNPQNPRNLNGHKGATRKSAGAAKPKAKAAGSVYVMTAEGKRKQQKADQKAKERQYREQERKNGAIADTYLRQNPRYRKFRRLWIVLVIVAVVAVGISWLMSVFAKDGAFLAALSNSRNTILYVGMGVGYAALIAALVVDFKFVRKMRKEKQAEVAVWAKKGKFPEINDTKNKA